jgi:hypothetical protein
MWIVAAFQISFFLSSLKFKFKFIYTILQALIISLSWNISACFFLKQPKQKRLRRYKDHFLLLFKRLLACFTT